MAECSCIMCSGKWENSVFTEGEKTEILLSILSESRAPSVEAEFQIVTQWQPIETAPKDGTRILAFGQMVEGAPKIVWDDKNPRVPAQMVIWWIEGWYDKDEPVGDGLFKKVPTLGYSYWAPEPQQFRPAHWMPLPEPPK